MDLTIELTAPMVLAVIALVVACFATLSSLKTFRGFTKVLDILNMEHSGMKEIEDSFTRSFKAIVTNNRIAEASTLLWMNFIVQNEIVMLITQVPPSESTKALIDRLNVFRETVTKFEDQIRDILTRISKIAETEDLFNINEIVRENYVELEQVIVNNRRVLYEFYVSVHEFTNGSEEEQPADVSSNDSVEEPMKQPEQQFSLEELLISLIKYSAHDKLSNEKNGLTVAQVKQMLPPYVPSSLMDDTNNEIREILNSLVKSKQLKRSGTGRNIKYFYPSSDDTNV